MPKLPVAGKVIHGLQPRNDHILTTTRSEISIANSNSACVLFPLSFFFFFFGEGAQTAPQIRDARRAVRASGEPCSASRFLIVNIAGGQREGLPVGGWGLGGQGNVRG